MRCKSLPTRRVVELKIVSFYAVIFIRGEKCFRMHGEYVAARSSWMHAYILFSQLKNVQLETTCIKEKEERRE